MAVLQYFNKIINITMSGSADAFKITCPKHGIKPSISISGSLSTKSQVNTLEIKLHNLYTSKPLTEYKKVIVEAGYENSIATSFVGSITGVFNSKPGPDKETTIIANVASISDWLETTANISEKAGTTLANAATELSNALGFSAPFIADDLQSKTLPAPLLINGTVREAVDALKRMFPGVLVIVNSNQLFFYMEDGTEKNALLHELKFLTQAPQYSGEFVTLNAPWLPNVRPMDIVKFPNKFYSLSNVNAVSSLYGKMRVATVQFSFGTYSENEMTVSGTAVE